MNLVTEAENICFDAILIQSGEIDAAYIDFPYRVEEVFGKKGMIKVKVVFDRLVSYRGILSNMGTGCHILIVRKDIRAKLKKSFGDSIHVCLSQDTEERTVEIPDDITLVFNNFPSHSITFKALSYTHRKELISWITDAKKQETRERRIEKMLQILEEKMTKPIKKN
ncbi:MAG: hypothetical protein FD155_2016 [Bacteroidetes bacterium]|nr:MAG: hypothetical protein FD155_2016 [Bacteroidota bacterium]